MRARVRVAGGCAWSAVLHGWLSCALLHGLQPLVIRDDGGARREDGAGPHRQRWECCASVAAHAFTRIHTHAHACVRTRRPSKAVWLATEHSVLLALADPEVRALACGCAGGGDDMVVVVMAVVMVVVAAVAWSAHAARTHNHHGPVAGARACSRTFQTFCCSTQKQPYWAARTHHRHTARTFYTLVSKHNHTVCLSDYLGTSNAPPPHTATLRAAQLELHMALDPLVDHAGTLFQPLLKEQPHYLGTSNAPPPRCALRSWSSTWRSTRSWTTRALCGWRSSCATSCWPRPRWRSTAWPARDHVITVPFVFAANKRSPESG